MSVFIALLRAVNVGGTGKLPMAELHALCEAAGFSDVKTYIQSGNVVFTSMQSMTRARQTLEAALEDRMGKPVGVHLRTPAELEALLGRNPFPEASASKVIVFFLEDVPPKDALEGVGAAGGEELVLSGRELFIHYPDGQGRSKLKVPFAKVGTGRNLNTVRKLLELGRAAEG